MLPLDQTIFDKVATHLLTQNARSFQHANGGICAYRGVGGTKCAIGALISDEHYTEDIEGLTLVWGDTVRGRIARAVSLSLGVEVLSPGVLRLLQDLQRLHDKNPPEKWRSLLLTTACRFELSPKVLFPLELYEDVVSIAKVNQDYVALSHYTRGELNRLNLFDDNERATHELVSLAIKELRHGPTQ